MSNSSRPQGLQPTSLLHPWDFPGNSTGVGWSMTLGNGKYLQGQRSPTSLVTSRTLEGLPGTDPTPVSSAVVLLWSTQIIVSHVYFLSFSVAKTNIKRKTLPTWWSWVCSPHTFWCLRIDNVNHPVTSTSARELCVSWSHTLGHPSFTWPLKMLCWSPLESSGVCGVGSGRVDTGSLLHSPCSALL